MHNLSTHGCLLTQLSIIWKGKLWSKGMGGVLQEASLADAQQRFQQEQAAAREALREFAPGFGAGKLLADAMARRTAEV